MAEHLFGITDAGQVRENNEDVFIAQEVMKGQFIIAGVIDGVGGYEGGEIAAAITKQVILDELQEVGTDVVSQLSIAFNLANEEIISRKLTDKNLADMACVATLAVIDKQHNLLHYIHVGDTRLYLYRDNSLIKLSKDQSFVGFLEDSGRITEEAAMQHPKRNQINQALGLESHEDMTDNYFETGSSPFLPGDLILLCSDGLTDMVDKASMLTILNHPQSLEAKAEDLVQLANSAGGKDNITVVLAKNDKVPVTHDISRPASPPKQQEMVFNAAPVREEPIVIPSVVKETPLGVIRKYKVWINLFFLLVVTAIGLWLWWDISSSVKSLDKLKSRVAEVKMNPMEQMIADSLLKMKGDTLWLKAEVFKTPVILSKALNITRDTLVIKTAGEVILQPDSIYKGTALILSSTSKHITIDGLTIRNFTVGITSYQHALDLKNVRFDHCVIPLQVSFAFADQSFVNGRIGKRNFEADSVAKK